MKKAFIKYRDWKLYSDTKTTQQTYANLKLSGAESCGCDSCKNFILQREKIFPDEIKKLFSELGIDYKKEIEITEFSIQENGLHYYNGWFQYKGDFEGKDCTVNVSDGYTFDLTKITENFSIGFRHDNALTPFEDKKGIVQIEFEFHIPWILKNKYQ